MQCSIWVHQTSSCSGPCKPEGACPVKMRPLWTHFTTTLSKTEGNQHYSDSEGKKKERKSWKKEEQRGVVVVMVVEIKGTF